jgi:hypothetical protein
LTSTPPSGAKSRSSIGHLDSQELSLLEPLPPGATSQGYLVYGIPKGLKPIKIEIHGDDQSPGAIIDVRTP